MWSEEAELVVGEGWCTDRGGALSSRDGDGDGKKTRDIYMGENGRAGKDAG